MPCATVFEEKNSLPGAKLHFAIDNRDRLARAGKDHADVRRHVVRTFVVVLKVAGIFRHELVENFSKSRRAAGAAFSMAIRLQLVC